MFNRNRQNNKKKNPIADFFLDTPANQQKKVLDKVAASVNRQQRKVLQESLRAGR